MLVSTFTFLKGILKPEIMEHIEHSRSSKRRNPCKIRIFEGSRFVDLQSKITLISFINLDNGYLADPGVCREV